MWGLIWLTLGQGSAGTRASLFEGRMNSLGTSNKGSQNCKAQRSLLQDPDTASLSCGSHGVPQALSSKPGSATLRAQGACTQSLSFPISAWGWSIHLPHGVVKGLSLITHMERCSVTLCCPADVTPAVTSSDLCPPLFPLSGRPNSLWSTFLGEICLYPLVRAGCPSARLQQGLLHQTP